MPGLVLELKQDELIIINGASIRFRTKARIEIAGKARFLFGKQILLPAEAQTEAAQLYVAIQSAYVGAPDDRPAAILAARARIAALTAKAAPLVQEILTKIMTLVEADDCYEALKLTRRIMRHEAAQTENATTSPYNGIAPRSEA
jgi:flagellar protein FlbT